MTDAFARKPCPGTIAATPSSLTMNPPPTHAAQSAPPGDVAAPPLQSLELRIELVGDRLHAVTKVGAEPFALRPREIAGPAILHNRENAAQHRQDGDEAPFGHVFGSGTAHIA